MDFRYFNVRGQRFMTSRTTLDKFKSSILYQLTIGSESEEVEIDRDAKHFETILNLMRQRDVVYLKGLRAHDLNEIKDELEYYNLTELVSMAETLKESILKQSTLKRKPCDIKVLYDDHLRYIADIRRPLVVLRLPHDYNDIMADIVPTVRDVSDSRYHDIKIFNEGLNRCNHQMQLYMPGSESPILHFTLSNSPWGIRAPQSSTFTKLMVMEFLWTACYFIIHRDEPDNKKLAALCKKYEYKAAK